MKKIFLSAMVLLCISFAIAQNTTALKVLPNKITGYNPSLETPSAEITKNILSSTTTAVAESQLPFMNVFVVPEKELIVIQWKNLNTENRDILLADNTGKIIQKSTLYAGSTIVFFDTQTLYSGDYEVRIVNGNNWISKKIKIIK